MRQGREDEALPQLPDIRRGAAVRPAQREMTVWTGLLPA